MDINITNKKEEKLMKRTFFEAKLVFNGKTPSRIDIKKDLCHKLESKDALTVISKIVNDYGSERAKITGYVYDDENTMKNLENKYVMLRHLSKTEQQAEKEKAKAAKQAAAPTSGKKKK
jgi:ribosomal protein S24E